MRAAVFEGTRNVVVREVPDPVAGLDEVVARVDAVGICGSELEAYIGVSSRREAPLILGHELAVSMDRDGASSVRYVVNPLRTCGHCPLCLRGRSNLCESRSLMSLQRQGGLAERVGVRLSDLHPISSEVPAVSAALVEPAATAANALDVEGGPRGKRVLVIGCGALGLLAVQIAYAWGAAEVVARDLIPERRRLAAEFGARTPERLDDSARFDLVLDMVGSRTTRETALRHCRTGGEVRFVGLLSREGTIDAADLISRGVRVGGVYAYSPTHIEQAIRLFEARKVVVDKMVFVGELKDAARYFEAVADDPSRWVKVVLEP